MRKMVRMGPIFNDEERTTLDIQCTTQEIKAAMFSIPDDKAPGLDGFGSAFYKSTWETTGPDIIKEIMEFFYNG